MALKLPNELLQRNVVPALWDGNIITPYCYDAVSGRYSSVPLSTYYYELPIALSIRGFCTVLVDIDKSTDDSVTMCSRLFPYVDKTPEHEGISRVVKDSFSVVNATKRNADPDKFFSNGKHQVSSEEARPIAEILPNTLCIELIDKAPDIKEEIINDLLAAEVRDEIDKETLVMMAKEVQ